ncbi:Saccharopine dehydrogenase [Caldithrix abyssi DSM 13497]|uniref:Saccharopine dehydrogenase n=1 Tax=Caldithrix abyssi DSM 13497 TaxID=880073 RepID=H1XX71_CALAY|nr:saccharopine dehydrogenase C-terminal domain-containing protein [Caldithrix abyssi]APF20691.1 saccharopine dehydrogenase (NADP+, L-glutamate forming) [Caldithrix abyssi DSM 13497]EHO40808.1 Saccharopine dehydrogenase [Caldithrix abyssi DSM 13497]
MNNVLLLGAGMVSRPLVRYLLEKTNVNLKVASLEFGNVRQLIESHPRASLQKLDVNDRQALRQVISEADVVISLLPWIHHMKVANLCLELNKHLVTSSYVKPEMRALDAEVKKRGLIFLNEMGVDPGIDHMAAMKVINNVKNRGGKIISFYSYCGGLPAPQNNNNPLGYKFSWSPVGVMLAALSYGQYLKDGKVVKVASEQLFEHYWFLDVPGAGTFEAYVNRDALPYMELYGIQEAQSMFRGTLRNVGHCETWNYFKKLGLFNQEFKVDFAKTSVKQAIARLINSDGKNLTKDIANFLNIPEYSVTLKKLEWLGLLSDEKLPLGEASIFDMFAHILQHKLVYEEGEVDLLIQHHEFIAEYPDGKREKLTSTLVDTGIPHGDTSMARTVGLPAAIATRLIVEGKINLKGVHIPVLPDIYEPILAELEAMNIKLVERSTWL